MVGGVYGSCDTNAMSETEYYGTFFLRSQSDNTIQITILSPNKLQVFTNLLP